MSVLPFTYPWVLVPTAILALLALAFGLFAQLRPGLGVKVVGQRPWLQGLGMTLILGGVGLGLAEPRFGLPEVPRLTVHVVLDASRSMNAPDGDEKGRSRWEVATELLDHLWSNNAPGVRYSLDLLAGQRVALLPPGEDRGLLRDTLRALKPGEFGTFGTAMGECLSALAGQAERKAPAVIFLVGDGEETWTPRPNALSQAQQTLKKAKLPVFAVALGQPKPQPVPELDTKEVISSTADPEFLRQLAEQSGGKLLKPDENIADLFRRLAQGELPLPVLRSHQPAHPEWGAWVALGGLALWLLGAGKPMRAWRMSLGLWLFLGSSGQAQGQLPLPEGVKAWMAQRALEQGDLATARRWIPMGKTPLHRLLAAQIELTSNAPKEALAMLQPLTGQGAPQPAPPWRGPALLLAARAQVALNQPREAMELLERLLKEQPGRAEAVHNLQSLLKDLPPPPPPRKRPPPPPPPPRPSQGARQDELEGIQQRLPQKQKPPLGIKDI